MLLVGYSDRALVRSNVTIHGNYSVRACAIELTFVADWRGCNNFACVLSSPGYSFITLL